MSKESDDALNESDLAWSDLAASLGVDELIAAKLIQPDKADWAREIIAQQIHILLVSGDRPDPV